MKKIIIILCLCGIGFGQIAAQTYTFNAKATFKIQTDEGSFSSYFYLNTKNGNAGHDAQAFQMMTKENVDGYIFSLVEYGKKMSQYMDVEGRKYVVEQPLSRENYTADMFWKEFKKTGKRQTFGKYAAQEYTGTSEDRKIAIWLGEKTYNLDGKLQGDIVGHYGVGYLFKPSENAYYLIVHFKDEDAQVTLLDIIPFSKSVALNGYEKIKVPVMPDTMLQGNDNPNQNEEPSNNKGQGYGMENLKCSSTYGAAISALEQSLSSYKNLLNNPQVGAEQKAEFRKMLTCLEGKLPLMKLAKEEALRAEQRYSNNQEKLMEECQKIEEKLEKNTAHLCP